MKKQIYSLIFLLFGALGAWGQRLQLLRDTWPGPTHGVFNEIKPVVFKGLAWFAADDGSDRALWRTDGTTAGTVRATAVNLSRNLSAMYPAGEQLFYVAKPDSVGLFVFSGTGTPIRVRSFGVNGEIEAALALPNGKLVFTPRRTSSAPFRL
jgi:ELWxxDGT repeat protein